MNKQLKILLVEDDNFLLNMYADKFRVEGFEVFIADNGATGLKLAKEKAPDLILLDVLLPKMSGFEVLQELNKDQRAKNIPVILLTNLSQKEEVTKGLELGAKDFLIKAHFMPQEVVAKVKSVLKI
ncbi:MAG TPA: response regulator [Candidatus Portnoybacteria bacterium]|uniref:Response regulator n=1 Tax=Candidatus Falkowbacteria bacterium CG10_big_fil_rev_8_21_14_0_10_44_15 TaxID=1974569 RepID=A0A2H0UYJ1_9BACT|nr:MAG: response regulator [Candidatus Falkowbacteria bacterium CG10_big_fil_rev_8_21_14_0_10_44_15]HCX27784.1 response regulator [Candidatus Portnoybacteria bacterium]